MIKQSAPAEAALNTFLTLSSDLFCIRGQDGRLKLLNPAWEKVLGWSESELLRTSWISFVHPEDVEICMQAEAQCTRSHCVDYESRYRHKDGSYRWLSWKVSKGDDGLFHAVGKDVTAAKESEETLRIHLEFEQLVTSLSTKFINLSFEEIDGEINRTLQLIGEYSGFDRSCVILFSEDGLEGSVAYQCSARAVEPLADEWQRFPTESYPWLMGKLRRFETLRISTIAEVPSQENHMRVPLLSSGTRSLTIAPMIYGKSLTGYVALAAVKEEKTCSQEAVALLRIVGDIFASALNRKRIEQDLQRTVTELTQWQNRYEAAGQTNGLLLYEWDSQTEEVIWGHNVEQVLGYPREELSGSVEQSMKLIHPDDVENVMRAVEQALATKEPLHVEYRMRQKDGTYITIEDNGQFYPDSEGNLNHMVGFIANITERKRTEAALRESEQRWQLALRGNNDGIWDLDIKNDRVFYSARWKEMLGYQEHEIPNESREWTNRVHPDDVDWVTQTCKDHVQGKMPYYMAEYRMQCKDGSYKWILDRGQALRDEAGNLVRIIGSHTDITERKQAEARLQQTLSKLEQRVEERTAELTQANEQLRSEIAERRRTEAALRQSEEQFRQVFEESSLGMALCSPERGFIRVNRAYLEMLGYTESEVSSLSFRDVTHPEDLELEIPYLQRTIAGELDGYQLEKRYLKKNQEIVWVNLTCVPLRDEAGEMLYCLGMVEDITERRRTEAALRHSEEQFRRVFEESPIGMALCKPEHGFVRVNRAFAEMLGYTESELLSISFKDVTHPEDLEREMPYVERALAGESNRYQLEKRYFKKNQDILWVDITCVFLRDEAREILYCLAMVEDITERKQAIEALQQSEARYRAIVEDQTELICRFKADKTLTFVNDAYCRYFNKERSELVGCSFLSLIPEADRATFTQSFSLSEEQPIATYEHRVILPSGEVRWQEWTDRAVGFDEQGKAIEFQGVGRDITELKQAEAEIRKALAKERELSELRSNFMSIVSHEFRNPLTAIQMSAEILGRYSQRLPDEQKQEHLRRIQDTVSHMTQLVEDILTIGKADVGKLEFEPSPMDLVAFCQDVVESLEMSVHPQHAIAFVTQGEGNGTNARMDEKLLRHIITNLLSNATKYSPQGGTVRFELVCTNSSAIFRIQDRGIGIPQKDLNKLFESFQRASNVGTIPGTGLGLAIVKKCVDSHGGKIAVESELGVGTTFTVTLPLS